MDVKRIVDEAYDEAEGVRAAIRAGLEEIDAPGLVEPTDAEFMAWVQTMAGAGDPELGVEPGKYPPTQITGPDGQQFVASPWLTMLEFVSGGDEVLARMARIQKKVEAS